MKRDDLLYDQTYLRNWDRKKFPVDPEFRGELVKVILEQRRDIFASAPAGHRKAELAALLRFHREQTAELKSTPAYIAAEAAIHEYISRRMQAWELWRKRPAGGVQ
jgi:hypothetical protein